MGTGEKEIAKVFAVIVTYNGSKWVDACLGSLKKSTVRPKTIVVDNNSSDDTVERITKNHPEVILVASKENLGFGKANNLAIVMALKEKFDYVFLLNQDAWVEEDTIERLLLAFQKNATFGILSPLHFNGSGTALDAGFANCIKKRYPQPNDFLDKNEDVIYTLPFINAAAWLVSAECIKKVGGFNPLFYHYGEDTDYVNRMKYHEFKIGFSSGCKIFHDREQRNFESSFATFKKLSWYYEVGISVKLSNPNHPLLLALIQVFVWSVKEIAFHFFKGRWFALRAWFHFWWRIFTRRNDILRSRESIKSKKPFLFLD